MSRKARQCGSNGNAGTSIAMAAVLGMATAKRSVGRMAKALNCGATIGIDWQCDAKAVFCGAEQ